MRQSINIHGVTEVVSVDMVLRSPDGRPIPLTEVTITTDDGSTITINLFDAAEVANAAP